MPEPVRRRPKLATVLRRAREERGLSIRQLAEASGVDKGVISRMESGTTRSPQRDSLNRLARVLRVEPSELHQAAGIQKPQDLPSLPVYFRQRYRSLPDEAVADIERYVEELQAKYGAGPARGEDEAPDARSRTRTSKNLRAHEGRTP
jgi:transcriptional regulator with XRE-family HTH domain